MNGLLVVAKKEYLENVRNAWILAVGGALLALTLAASLFASLGDVGAGVGFAPLVRSLVAMQSVSGFLIPILALMLGFGTLAGERESGSLALLVAQPLTRAEILFGKALGLWGVLATAVLGGVGVGGAVILARTGAGGDAVVALLLFLVETLLWGAAWTAITMLVSAWFQRRGTAIAGGVLVWFLFSVLWGILTVVLLFVSVGASLRANPGDIRIPGWFILLQVLNPNNVYSGLLALTIPGYDDSIRSLGQELIPETYNAFVFAAAMAAWIALPLLGAYALFARRDV